MKHLALALAALAACARPTSPPGSVAGATTPEAAAGGPAWFRGSWDELLAAARAERKLVLLDFWASW
jgi:hypothetical protein